jgi:glycosyltransferase involved in cell wall biosynthesis
VGVTTRIETIPNVVDLQRLHPAENRQDFTRIREVLDIGPGELMVTNVGAVMPRKGSDPLLEAWRCLLKSAQCVCS